ncbi:MAG: beta-lactamase family protein [Verrucomicrobiae bacterium]|nr:beta-lactamase family protein [Verrucomicrobiae bacterium]
MSANKLSGAAFGHGLSRERLKKLGDALGGYVARGEMPGLAALISRGESVHVETLGFSSIGGTTPARVKGDTIFRIASLTKPITAVGAMILVEDCKIRLDDSIEPWIPELGGRRVLKSISSQLDETVPARRAITVRDVLTYRMGFGSVMAPADTHPIQRKIRELQIGGDGPPLPAKGPSTQQWLNHLASLPWMAQPGERWMYHVSGDVLGILIERVSGRPLGDFLRERLFEPLGMKDTAFHVPPSKLSRFSVSYRFDRAAKKLVVYDDVKNSSWGPRPPFESGGGGLVGTIEDYFKFCRMMLNKGRLGRERILSRASVELMTSDHLKPEHRAGSEMFFGEFSSWGLGMGVDIARRDVYHSPGRFGWTGGLGTSAYTDPANDLIAMIFTPRMMDSPEPPKVFTDFFTLAYAAIE